MTVHRIPMALAAEEVLPGFFCATCGEWVAGPNRDDCPGPEPTPTTGGLDSDGR